MENDLIDQVGKILHGYSMVGPGMHLGVAVSGGADSVTLLHILYALREVVDCRLTVLHFNHQLRARESEKDEEFVRHLARSLSVPVVCRSEPLAAGNLEQEARRARQIFFQQWRAEAECARVALGHTRSDQAETLLFRLFRGSGLTGLAGMLPVTRSGLIRPLLFTSRGQVRDFAAASGFAWREDASNLDLRFRRNRLRLQTIPRLSDDYNPALEEALARTAQLAADEEAYWERRTRRLYRRLVTRTHYGLTLPVDGLSKLQIAEQRRLLRRAVFGVRNTLRSIDAGHIQGILKICGNSRGHERIIVPGVDAIRSFGTLLLAPPEMMRQARGYVVDVPLSQEINLPFQLGKMIVNRVNTNRQNYVTVKNAGSFFSYECFLDRCVMESLDRGDSLQVRNWEPGDLFRCEGAPRPEKIKTLFQENRIVLWERRHWPVLVVGGRIAWIRGFGVDAGFHPRVGSQDLLHIQDSPA